MLLILQILEEASSSRADRSRGRSQGGNLARLPGSSASRPPPGPDVVRFDSRVKILLVRTLRSPTHGGDRPQTL